jgi:hypothetical protein
VIKYTQIEKKGLVIVYAFEVTLTNGLSEFLFGYSYQDAVERSTLNPADIKKLIDWEYLD